MRPIARYDYEQKILDTIDEHGWFDTHVFDPEESDPTFSYSVGFTETLAAPEFIVFGLEMKLMHNMLWSVFRQIRAGKAVMDGARWDDVLNGFECVSRRVDPSNVVRDYMNSAMWFWGDEAAKGPVPVFQLVWPGAVDGLFPWDEGCSETVRDFQPPLYMPRSMTH
jgi:hypothetical protein